MDDFTLLDSSLSDMVAQVELEGQTCGLKHSKHDPAENHPAVDYLCQNLGDTKSKEATSQIRIPICEECAEALYDPDWILAYCIYCNRSQWIYRPMAKTKHPEGNGIYWCDVCPFCAEVTDQLEENK
jgi:hypothetical protein